MDIKGQDELYGFLNNQEVDGEVLYAKSFDDFKNQFSNPESQQSLYNNMVADGFYPKDKSFGDFTNQFFGAEKKNPIENEKLVETEPLLETQTVMETEPEKKPQQPKNTASQQGSAKPKSSSGGGMMQIAGQPASGSKQPKPGKSQGSLLIVPKDTKPLTTLEGVLQREKEVFDITNPDWAKKNAERKKEADEFYRNFNIPVVTKRVTEAAKNLAQQAKTLESDKAQLDDEVKSFEAAVKANPKNPALIKMQADLNKRIDAQNKINNEFQTQVTQFNQDRADLKRASAMEAIKNAEKGNFLGATWNSIVEGYKKIGQGQARVAIDLVAEVLDAAGMPLSADKNMTKDEAKKAVIAEINPALSKGYDVAKSEGTTQAYIEKQKKSGILPKAYYGSMESLPVMASGGTVPRLLTGATMTYQYINDELDGNPATAGMDENERKMITVPIAIIGGILEEVGFRTLIGKNKPLLVKAAKEVLAQLPENATVKTIKDVATKVMKTTAGKVAGKMATGYLGEAETGGAQRLSDYSVKELYDFANKSNLFKNPETFTDLLKQVGEDANIEGVGGMILRTIGIGSSAIVSVTGVGQMSDEDYKAWSDLATNPEQGKLYLSKVISDLSSGRITKEEADKRINDFDRASNIAKQIPNNLSIADQKKAAAIIAENEKIQASVTDLQKYMEGKNPNLVSNINKQIEDLQKRIEENNNQLTKLSENAVQEQTTSEVPVQPEAGTSLQVAEGEPQAEPQVSAQEGQGQEVARNESTVDNTIAADYLLTGGLNTIRSTDYLLKGIAGVFGKAGKLIDNIRNKYAKELSDNNLVDINNFLGTDTYDKIVSEIRDAIKQSYGENADIESIFNEVLQYPTGMPNRIGNNIESRIAALEGQGQEVESKLREQYGLEPLKPTYRGTTLDEWENVKNGGKFKSNQGFGENEEDVTWVSDSKEYSDEYVKSNENGVLIEFKPEAIDKSTSESGQQNDNTGVRLGRGLTLDDVQRVTDANGNVLYEAESKTTSKEGQGQEVKDENVILSGLSSGFKAVTPNSFDPRSDEGVAEKVQGNKSFATKATIDGKNYVVVGLRLNQDVGAKTSGRDGYTFAAIEDTGNLPNNVVDILTQKAIENTSSVYPNITNVTIDSFKPVEVSTSLTQTEPTPSTGGMIQMAPTEQPTEEPVVEQPTAEEPATQEPTAEEPITSEDKIEEDKPTEMSEKEWNDLQNLADRIANGEDINSDKDSQLQEKYPTTLNSLVAKKVSELPKQEAPEPTTKLSQGQKNAIKEGIKKAQDMVKRYPKQDDLLTKYRALKDFKKTNQEYIDANQSQKDAMIRNMNVSLGLAPKFSAPSAQSIVGPRPKMTTIDEAKALRDQLLLEEKAAESGKEFINNARKIVIDAIKNRTKGALSPKATKALLNALGGKIDTPKQRAEVISKVIDIFKKSEDVVAVKESTLRDNILNIINKSTKQGRIDFKKAVKDLADEIKGMLPKGVFSTAQVKIVANALATNLLNPKLRQEAVDRVMRMANNVAEATKLKNALNIRANINKVNTERLGAELADIAKGFGHIDPKNVDNIDQYIEEAQKVFDAIKKVKVTKNKKTGEYEVDPRIIIDYSSTQDYTKDQLDRQEEITKNALLEQYKDLVAEGKISKSMSLAQLQQYVKSLEQDPENNNEDKDQALRDFAEQSFKESKDALNYEIANGLIDSQNEKLISQFVKIDLSLLSPLEAYEAAEALMNFRKNGSTSKMGKIASNYKGALGVTAISESINREGKVEVGGNRIKAYKAFGKVLDGIVKLTTLGKKNFKISENIGKIYSNYWLKFNATVDNFGVTYFGPNNWKIIKEAAGIDDIETGVVDQKKIVSEFGKEIYDKYKDAKVGKDKVFTDKVSKMIGIVANLYRETSDSKQKETYFSDRKNILKEAIDYLKSSDDSDKQKQGELLEEIYNQLGIEDAKNGQEVFDKADPVVQNIITDFVNKFKNYHPEFARIAQEQFNIILGNDKNYTSDSWIYVGQDEKTSAEKLFKKGNFTTGHNIIETEESGKFIQPKYPSKLPTKNGKVIRIPSYDFFKDQMDALAETVNTVKTIAGVNQYIGFMDSPNLKKLIPDDASRKLFKDKLDFNVSLYQKNEKIPPRNYSRWFADLMRWPMRQGAKLGLSSFEAPFIQSLPILASTLANIRNPGYELWALQYVGNPKMQNFLNNTKYSITQRGGESQTSIDYVNNMLEKGDYSTPAKGLQNVKKATNFLVDKGLVGMDVLTAKSTWMAYYMDELAQQGINPLKIDWDNHQVNDRAAKYADSMVKREQNVNLPESGGKLWASSDPYMKIARMTMPFGNFITNQKDKIKTNMAVLSMDSNLATKEEKIAAARSIVGSTFEIAAFNAIKAKTASLILDGAYNIVGKRPTDEEEELRRKRALERTYEDYFETFMGSSNAIEKEIDAAVGNYAIRMFENIGNVGMEAIEKDLNLNQIIDKLGKADWAFIEGKKDKKEEEPMYAPEPGVTPIPLTETELKAEKLKKEIKKPFRLREPKEEGFVGKAAEFIGGVPKITYDIWVKTIATDIANIKNGYTETKEGKKANFTKKEKEMLLKLLPLKLVGNFGGGREWRKLYDEVSKIFQEKATTRERVERKENIKARKMGL